MQPNVYTHSRLRNIANLCLTLLGLILFVFIGAKALGHIGDKKVVTGKPRIAQPVTVQPVSSFVAEPATKTVPTAVMANIPESTPKTDSQASTSTQSTTQTETTSFSQSWSYSYSSSTSITRQD